MSKKTDVIKEKVAEIKDDAFMCSMQMRALTEQEFKKRLKHILRLCEEINGVIDENL